MELGAAKEKSVLQIDRGSLYCFPNVHLSIQPISQRERALKARD